MQIKTNRLLLIPLPVEQLALLIFDCRRLEAVLDCHYNGEPLENEFLQILKKQVAAATYYKTIYPEDYPFYTFWLLMKHDDRCIIGTACFKDRPNASGEVEIGYGLADIHQGFGYMAEAVSQMCQWAFAQENVRFVTAETDKENLASQHVLGRCGFVPYSKEQSETLWWRVAKAHYRSRK